MKKEQNLEQGQKQAATGNILMRIPWGILTCSDLWDSESLTKGQFYYRLRLMKASFEAATPRFLKGWYITWPGSIAGIPWGFRTPCPPCGACWVAGAPQKAGCVSGLQIDVLRLPKCSSQWWWIPWNRKIGLERLDFFSNPNLQFRPFLKEYGRWVQHSYILMNFFNKTWMLPSVFFVFSNISCWLREWMWKDATGVEAF